MSGFNSWQSGTAALMAVSIVTGTTAPMIAPAPASAQYFPQETQVTIPAGTSIPVRYDNAEKIVVSTNETVPVTLRVATNIINRRGVVLIPAGSQIVGQLQPVQGGAQFVASELVTSQGRRQEINATSRVITRTQQVQQGVDTGNILKGAVLGSAAAAGISGIVGNRHISAGKVLLGTGVGAAGGALLGRKKVDVVVIKPNTDLNLTLRSALPLGY